MKQQLLLGKSTHAGFNGERVTNPPARGQPFLPLKPRQAAALGSCCSSVGCQGAVGTVAGSQESGWSHSGPAGSPRAPCPEPARLLLPQFPGAGIFQPIPHLHWAPLEFGTASILILAVPSEGSSSQCQLCSQGLQLQEAKRGLEVSELAFLGHQIHIKTFDMHNPTKQLNYKLPSTCIYSPLFFSSLKTGTAEKMMGLFLHPPTLLCISTTLPFLVFPSLKSERFLP